MLLLLSIIFASIAFLSAKTNYCGASAGDYIECTDGTKTCYRDTFARACFGRFNISVHASENDCSDRNNPHCTSLDQIHEATIDGVIEMKIEAACNYIFITGGTEVGHDPGHYSHGAGWKVDLRGMPCLDDYIPFMYTQHAPNNYCNYGGFLNCSQYYYEISHWDWNFGIGPGCGC